VYRRLVERLSTPDVRGGALRSLVDGWFYALEEEVLAAGGVDAGDEARLVEETTALMETRLATVTRHAPAFAACLRGYRARCWTGNGRVAEGLLRGSAARRRCRRRSSGTRGSRVSSTTSARWPSCRGCSSCCATPARRGSSLVLDEVETIQRVRGDVRERALNALRQLWTRWTRADTPGSTCW
jgi:hypothetical protein